MSGFSQAQIDAFHAQPRCECGVRLVVGGCPNFGCRNDVRKTFRPDWYENRAGFLRRREVTVEALEAQRDAKWGRIF